MIKKRTILAVDDTPANLIALESVLDRDFDLRYATSGPEAIASLKEKPDVDVILMDLQMPVMDGYETVSHIKKIPGCEDTPIVFITAVFKDDPFVKRGYEVGGIDYFTKPFDPDLLRMKMSVYSSFRHKAAILAEREHQIRETEQLMRAGRKLAATLESLAVGVLIADVDGRICQVNEEVSRIFKSVDLIDSDAYGAMLGWWASGDQALKDPSGALARALRTAEPSHREVTKIRCFDGSSKTIRIAASPLLGLTREVVGAVIVVNDLTEHKEIEAELETRIARLISLGVELEQGTSSVK